MPSPVAEDYFNTPLLSMYIFLIIVIISCGTSNSEANARHNLPLGTLSYAFYRSTKQSASGDLDAFENCTNY